MPFVHEQLNADGSSSLGRIVAVKAIIDIITADHVATLASVVNGGAGYAVGETFVLTTGSTVAGSALYPARGIVTAVSSGVVTAVRLVSAGAYTTLPEGDVSTADASLSGDDNLTVTITGQTALWTADRNTYADDLTDFEIIATSVKASNAPIIGMQTFDSSGDGAARMLGATGFNAGSTFAGQPGASPVATTILNFPGTDPEIYLSITERRVNMLIRNGNNVQLGVLGLFIPFTDTDANYPLPACAFAQSRQARPFSESWNLGGGGTQPNASVINPGTSTSDHLPYFYLDNLSAEWLSISENNANGARPARSQMWPYRQGYQDFDFTFAPQLNGKSTNPMERSSGAPGALAENAGSTDSGWFEGEKTGDRSRGIPGVAPLGPNSRMSFPVQPHIVSNRPDLVELIGITDGLLAVHGRGLTAFEDIVNEAGSRFLVFPDTNSTSLAHWIAMERV